MSDDGITKVKRDPARWTNPDLSRFKAMSEEERHAAAWQTLTRSPRRMSNCANAPCRPNVASHPRAVRH